MTTPALWWQGARPRTLPAAVAPVLVGTGAAHALGRWHLGLALLALVVALALQVGVNYANDYSDGIRGTDDDTVRVGPVRLVGQRLAAPAAIKRAALVSLGVAALAGLALVLLSGAWVLLPVGALCVLAAWYYTGGRRPYAYRGLGEVSVFVFFGLVAVLGTTWSQAQRLDAAAVAGACAVGSLACALLVVNNLRDLDGDAAVGKRTLAVRLGAARTRRLYQLLVLVPFALALVVALQHPWALVTLLALVPALPAVRAVGAGTRGRDLIAVLGATGRVQLLYAVLLTSGLALS